MLNYKLDNFKIARLKYLRDMACLRVNKGGKIRIPVITFQATLAGVMNCVRFTRMGTRGKIQLSLPSFAADCSASEIRRPGRQEVTTYFEDKDDHQGIFVL